MGLARKASAMASCKLIMVMGVQRSGTNVLFESLATDRTLSAFPEDIDSAFYYNFLLRPVGELTPLIERVPGRILLKPITETGRRSLVELAQEYRSYALRFVWIYRDPVNVFDSMRRERWIAAEDVDQPAHILGWRKRNEYALEFQQQNPEQIAIVRYEDLCLDPKVFRQLTRWLRANCSSYFRKDSAEGRKCTPSAAQKNIDAGAGETLRALDAARRFRARLIPLLKRRIFNGLMSGKVRAQNEDRTVIDRFSQIPQPPGPSRLPSAAPSLQFWLRSAAVSRSHGLLTDDIAELGPHGMIAAIPDHGPYGLVSLVQRGTLYYPHSKTEERRRGPSGTLRFGTGHDWNFFFDNTGFTVFALFRPNVPCYPPYNQDHSILLRLGPQSDTVPAFFLEWDGGANCSSARIVWSSCQGTIETRAVSTRLQSHRRDAWALIAVEYTGGRDGKFSISANGIAGDSITAMVNASFHPDDDYVLEVGGFTAQPEALFYGELAEIVISKGPLPTADRSAITAYLIETHRL
jgi:hypothetical protein